MRLTRAQGERTTENTNKDFFFFKAGSVPRLYLVGSTEFFNVLLDQHALDEPDNSVGAHLIGFDTIELERMQRMAKYKNILYIAASSVIT